MKNDPLPRLDSLASVRNDLIPHCRLKPGEIWIDPVLGHRVGCLDATDSQSIRKLMDSEKAQLAIHDPPYNLVAFEQKSSIEFVDWCKKWILHTNSALSSREPLNWPSKAVYTGSAWP